MEFLPKLKCYPLLRVDFYLCGADIKMSDVEI